MTNLSINTANLTAEQSGSRHTSRLRNRQHSSSPSTKLAILSLMDLETVNLFIDLLDPIGGVSDTHSVLCTWLYENIVCKETNKDNVITL